MPENSRRKLYDALTANDYDIGSFEEFDAKMNIPDSRRKFYDGVSKDFDLGSFEQFETKISPTQQNTPSPQRSVGTFQSDVAKGLGLNQPGAQQSPEPTMSQPLSQGQLEQQVFKNADLIGKPESAPKPKKVNITAIPGSKLDLTNKRNTYLNQLNTISTEQKQILAEYEPKIAQLQSLNEAYNNNPTPEVAQQINDLSGELFPVVERVNKLDKQAKILQAGVRNADALNQVNLEKNFGFSDKTQAAVGNTVANLVNSAGKIVETIGDYNYELGEAIGDSHEENVRTHEFDEKLAAGINDYYKKLEQSVNREVPDSYKAYSPIGDKLNADKLLYFGMNSMAQLAPVVTATLATGGAGGVATGFTMEYGGMYDSFHEPLKQKYLAEGLSEEEADKKADLEAGLMASTGAGIVGTLDRFGASGLINSTVKKQLLRTVTKEAVEELGEKTAKEAIESSLLKNLKNFGKGFASATAPEAATEFAQELVGPGEMDVYDYITDGNTFQEGLANKETWIRAADAGVGALIASSPGGIIGGVNKITPQAYSEAMNATTQEGLDKLVSDIQSEVDAGMVPQDAADDAIANIKKIQETDAKIPDNITNPEARVEAINLINEREAIASQIEGKDEALIKPLVKRQEEINKRLTDISEGKINEQKETPEETESERTSDIALPEQPAASTTKAEGEKLTPADRKDGSIITRKEPVDSPVKDNPETKEIKDILMKGGKVVLNEDGTVKDVKHNSGASSQLYKDLSSISGDKATALDEYLKKKDDKGEFKKSHGGDWENGIMKEYGRAGFEYEIMRGKPEGADDNAFYWTRINKDGKLEIIFNDAKSRRQEKFSEAKADYISEVIDPQIEKASGEDKLKLQEYKSLFEKNVQKTRDLKFEMIHEALINRMKGEITADDKIKSIKETGRLRHIPLAKDFLGEPKVFMHAGAEGISKFKSPGEAGYNKKDAMTGDTGIYFTGDVDYVKDKSNFKDGTPGEGEDIYYVFLKYENPYYMSDNFAQGKVPIFTPSSLTKDDELDLMMKGYDAVIWDKESEGTKRDKYEVVVFDPDQVEIIGTYRKGLLGDKKEEKQQQTKEERKKIASAKIDEIANALKDILPKGNLPDGTKKSGIGQDEIIDLIASAVKALVNTGIEIDEAIKTVRAKLEKSFDTTELSDEEIKSAIENTTPDQQKEGENNDKGKIEREGPRKRKDVLSPETEVEGQSASVSPEKTGVKHAETEKLRKEFDIPEYAKEAKNQEKLDSEANEKLKSGYDVQKLIGRMEKGSLPTDVEQIILTKYIAGLADKIAKNPTNELLQEATRAIEASDRIGGSEVARSLAARRTMEVRDKTLLDYFVEDIEANEGAMLTESQKKLVQKEYTEITTVQKELEDKISSLIEENNRLRSEQNIKKNKGSKTNKTHEDYVQERKQIKDDIKKKIKALRKETNLIVLPYVHELVTISPEISKLVKSYVSEGITKLDEIVAKIHESLSEDIPEITKEDVLALIAGEYQRKNQTRSEINRQIYELKQEAKLIKRIEDIQKGIEPGLPEAKRIQKNRRLEQLRKQIKESDLGRLADYKKRVLSHISKLEEDIANNNIKEIEPKKPIKLDVEAIRLKDKYIKLKQEREVRLLKEKYKNRTNLEKAKEIALEVLNLPRTVMSSMDFSAPLRQAAVATASHPIIALRAFKEMFKQAFSQKKFDRWFYDVRNDYRFISAQESGLYISDPHDYRLSSKEEAFMNNLAEKIPFIGRLIKGSERAYVSYLNKMRWDLYNNFAEEYEKEGRTPYNSPDLYKGLASYINNATGRGGFGNSKIGKAIESNPELLNAAFFSPRLVASRINFLNPLYYAKLPKEVRILALKDLAKFIGLGMTVLFLANLAGDDDEKVVELDPRSTDFGKIRFGDTRWDIWGGYQQYIRVMAQLLSGQTKSASTGELSTLDGEGAFGRTRGDVLFSFVRGKLAPVPSAAVDFLTTRTVVGDRVTAFDEAKSHLMPLIYKDVAEAIKDNGVKAIFTTGIPAVFGVGVSTYKNRHDKYVIDDLEHPVSENAKVITKAVEKMNKEVNEEEKKQSEAELSEVDAEFNTTDKEKSLRESLEKVKNKIPIIVSELERIEPNRRAETLDRWISIEIAPASMWDYIDIIDNGDIVLRK